MALIDGNQVAETIIAELKAHVASLKGRKPCLALVRVGDDPASVSYVRKKEKTAAEIGVWAPILLVTARVLQGFALGGEYGGAAIYVAEHARADRRGVDRVKRV